MALARCFGFGASAGHCRIVDGVLLIVFTAVFSGIQHGKREHANAQGGRATDSCLLTIVTNQLVSGPPGIDEFT